MAVEQVASAKSLGIYMKQTLNWECHREKIFKNIASAIGAIFQYIRHQIPFNIVVSVYNSLVQPHFDYCNVVWGNFKKGLSLYEPLYHARENFF